MAKSSSPIKHKSIRPAGSPLPLTADQALALTKRSPHDPAGWKEYGRHLLNSNDPLGAEAALKKSAELSPDDPGTWLLMGFAALSTTNESLACRYFAHTLTLQPDTFDAHLNLAYLLLRQNEIDKSTMHIDKALALRPCDGAALQVKAQLLKTSAQYEAAGEIFVQLIQQDPRNAYSYWNDLGNIKRELVRLDEARECYEKSLSLGATNPVVLSNHITLLHYLPDCDMSEILEQCKKWGLTFAPHKPAQRPHPSNISHARTLRIGMISDGFRQHPVGAMITPALEHLHKYGIELHMYSSSGIIDGMTEKIRSFSARWTSIFNFTDEDLAERIRTDEIDILIDLSGHNAGTRMRAIALEPAPLIVKWVGGLIGTTGVKSIDYLITDSIESPPGSDSLYTEKLIRMPDDYICYLPPKNLPEVRPLPALKNGYITFGCFNNPTKVNKTLLGHWSDILNAVPKSRLYLKGGPFGSESLRQSTIEILASHGIEADRILMEGQSGHFELLDSYNNIDIALDPWPYSGGLTTCEAMLMGVPVITLPGPTFAGRHSATHLVNAGMPELVVATWSEYQARAIELASDLQSLSTIRDHLRHILLQSVVCDGAKFSRHLADALRAIWQRYCQKKSPAALAFTPEGLPWFEDEDVPCELNQPAPIAIKQADSFQFELRGKIVTLDHGGTFTKSPRFSSLSQLKTLTTIAIDPARAMGDVSELIHNGSLQHYEPGIALGDGGPATIYACLDASFSSTLEPLPALQQIAATRQNTTVLTKLPVPTMVLDQIEGLGQLDWLILDDRHDPLKILRGAKNQLENVLIVQARISFLPLYSHQPDLGQISAALAPYGLNLLRLERMKYGSSSPRLLRAKQGFEGSKLLSADAIFIPDETRLKTTDPSRLLKLGFLLHTAYGAPDAAYVAVELADKDAAQRYLTAGGWTDIQRSPIVRSPELLLTKKATHRAVIGVPTYNEEKYIAQTIQSLVDQDADGTCFLISDNCSNDRTIEIIQDLTAGDERFEIFQHETNRGAATNFAFLLQNSASDYFMWLGAHDYLSPDYVSKAIRLLDQHPELSMAFGSPHSVNGSNIRPLPSAIYDFSNSSPAQRYLDSVIALSNCTIIHSMFRRMHLNDFEMREVLSGDHVLISHLLWKGYLHYMDEPKYYRRYFDMRTDTASERITGRKIELSLDGLFSHYRDNLASLCKDVMPAEEADKLQAIVQSVLRRRFG